MITPRGKLGLALLGAFVAACRQNDDAGGAEQLLAQVQADDYRSWARAPGYEGRVPSSAPHSDNVEIFVNDIVEAALAGEGASEWPVGSLIVKDGTSEAGELELIALMEKREDGWYWAEYDGSGAALYSGDVEVCVDCHASGADFVRAFGLP